ncbi:hypothetical protein Tco_1301704 [Tanacetum coccineum]
MKMHTSILKKFLRLSIYSIFPNITQDQIMLRSFLMSLTRATSQWIRNKPSGSIKTWEDLKAKFLSKYCSPTRTSKKMEEFNNFQQEPDETLYQEWERFKELIMKCPQHYLTEMQEVILFYNGLEVSTRQILDSKGQEVLKLLMDSLPSKHNLIILEGKSRRLTRSRLYDDFYKEEKGSYVLKDLDAYLIGTTLCNDALPQKEKDSGSFTLPCYINNVCFEKALADIGASINVMPLSTYLNLGLGEFTHTKLIVELADRTVKHPKGIAENVLVGISKFVFPIDFIVLDMPEDVNVSLFLGRPFLSTAHAKVDVFKIKITLRVGDENIIFKSVKPAIVEDMGPYLDEGMGDVIVGEPFYKASCMEARRLDGIITIRDGNDSVTYQMVRPNPRFKHLTNEKYNKIPLLLKVSEQDKMNGISHSYQKLKGFYKEGPRRKEIDNVGKVSII